VWAWTKVDTYSTPHATPRSCLHSGQPAQVKCGRASRRGSVELSASAPRGRGTRPRATRRATIRTRRKRRTSRPRKTQRPGSCPQRGCWRFQALVGRLRRLALTTVTTIARSAWTACTRRTRLRYPVATRTTTSALPRGEGSARTTSAQSVGCRSHPGRSNFGTRRSH
jgi:hypothetical protein